MVSAKAKALLVSSALGHSRGRRSVWASSQPKEQNQPVNPQMALPWGYI